MYGSDYEDDECDAAPGLMGHLACNKSCCRGFNDGIEKDTQEGVGWGGIEFTGRSTYAGNSEIEYDQGIPVDYSAPSEPETFKIKYVEVIHETEKAVQYLVKDGRETLWLPKSVHRRGKKKLKILKWFKPRLAYVKKFNYEHQVPRNAQPSF